MMDRIGLVPNVTQSLSKTFEGGEKARCMKRKKDNYNTTYEIVCTEEFFPNRQL